MLLAQIFMWFSDVLLRFVVNCKYNLKKYVFIKIN